LRRRSNTLVLVGIAFLVVGAAIVFLVARDDSSDPASAAAAGAVPVLVAKDNLAAGQEGNALISQNKVEVKFVSPAQKTPGALSSKDELANALLARTFSKGEQLTVGGLRPQSLLSKAVEIPKGLEAMAVSTDFTNGGAGYVAPGDLVNVYAVLGRVEAKRDDSTRAGDPVAAIPYPTPRAELLLTNVKVLDVNTEEAPFRSTTPATQAAVQQTRTSSGSITLLLAVNAVDAEKLILVQTQDSLYFSRVADKNPPVPDTPGSDFFNLFDDKPGTAFSRNPV
jgi:Flp pilus assembly protein CpaB